MNKIIDALVRDYNNHVDDVNYQIASYILHHMSSIKEHTLLEFSKNAYVSKSSALKYMKELGYDHFKTFIIDFNEEYEKTNHYFDVIRKEIIYRNIPEYFDTQNIITQQQLMEIKKILKNIKRVFILGDYRAIGCLYEFQILLLFKGIDAIIINIDDQKKTVDCMISLREDDLLFIVSPLESIEAVIDTYRYHEINHLNEIMNKAVQKIYIGQKSGIPCNFNKCIYIELPFSLNYYSFLYNIIELFNMFSISLLK